MPATRTTFTAVRLHAEEHGNIATTPVFQGRVIRQHIVIVILFLKGV
jgi:hypothetical protein